MLLYIILRAVSWLIDLINFLILVSAILSWFPINGNSRLLNILFMLTEPVLAPARKLLYRFEFTRNLPVDFSPIVAMLFLGVISYIVNLIAAVFIRI